jgi:hypothetical protein
MIALPTIDALDSVTIPIACPVPWDEMHGDNRTRFCDQCRQNVHDVSALTRSEALQLLSANDHLPCLRIYRRPDGRIMTADCATRRERVWKWLDRRSTWAAWLFAMVFFTGCTQTTAGIPCWVHHQPLEPIVEDAGRSVIEGVISGVAAANENGPGQ